MFKENDDAPDDSCYGSHSHALSDDVRGILEAAQSGRELSALDAERLLTAEGPDFHALIAAADLARHQDCGDDVSYVVCRNINFTNICYVGCSFCGFARHMRAPSSDRYLHT